METPIDHPSASRIVEKDSKMLEDRNAADDSASGTLTDTSPSLNEKAIAPETGLSTSESPENRTIITPVKPEPSHDDHPELKRTASAKDAQAELERIMTSGEGVEYPTGVKLG